MLLMDLDPPYRLTRYIILTVVRPLFLNFPFAGPSFPDSVVIWTISICRVKMVDPLSDFPEHIFLIFKDGRTDFSFLRTLRESW